MPHSQSSGRPWRRWQATSRASHCRGRAARHQALPRHPPRRNRHDGYRAGGFAGSL